MGFFTKKHDGLNTFVFNVDDYAELTYDQLIEVNGGCGSSGRSTTSYGRTGVTGSISSSKTSSGSYGGCGGSSGGSTSSSRSSTSSSYGGCGGSNGSKASTSKTLSSTYGACGGSASSSASSLRSTTVTSTYGACGSSGKGSSSSASTQTSTTTTTVTTNTGTLAGSKEDFLEIVSELDGTPYVYGGNDPETGLDCSGIVIYGLEQQGNDIADQSVNELYHNGEIIEYITAEEAEPGDLRFILDKDGNAEHVQVILNDEGSRLNATGTEINTINNPGIIETLDGPVPSSGVYGRLKFND